MIYCTFLLHPNVERQKEELPELKNYFAYPANKFCVWILYSVSRVNATGRRPKLVYFRTFPPIRSSAWPRQWENVISRKRRLFICVRERVVFSREAEYSKLSTYENYVTKCIETANILKKKNQTLRTMDGPLLLVGSWLLFLEYKLFYFFSTLGLYYLKVFIYMFDNIYLIKCQYILNKLMKWLLSLI